MATGMQRQWLTPAILVLHASVKCCGLVLRVLPSQARELAHEAAD
jgi:hypothetical protein